jgi:hypothetical protein
MNHLIPQRLDTFNAIDDLAETLFENEIDVNFVHSFEDQPSLRITNVSSPASFDHTLDEICECDFILAYVQMLPSQTDADRPWTDRYLKPDLPLLSSLINHACANFYEAAISQISLWIL